jgi:hypothetical protein
MPDSSIPMGEWSGSDATERLRETMVELSDRTERQTRQIVVLTVALVVLTVALVVLTVVLVVDTTSCR